MEYKDVYEQARACGIQYSELEKISKINNVPYGVALHIIINNGKYPIGTKTAQDVMQELREKSFISVINSDREAKQGFEARAIAMAGIKLEAKLYKAQLALTEYKHSVISLISEQSMMGMLAELEQLLLRANDVRAQLLSISKSYSDKYEKIMQYNVVLYICSKVPWDLSSYEVNKYYEKIYRPQVKIKSHIQDMKRLAEHIDAALRKMGQ